MKLTLSAGGGFTGLAKTCTIDVDALDAPTRTALMAYFREAGQEAPSNYGASWSLDDGQEVPVVPGKLGKELEALHGQMEARLSYDRS